MSTERRQSIQVIERMMKLLDALAQHDGAVSLKQLSLLTGLHPSSAHRILASMVAGRIVDRPEPGAYQLGLRLIDLGNRARARIEVRRAAVPCMQALHTELGETVNLVVREGDEVLYVDRVGHADAITRASRIIGARAPLHVTAVGKLFLAHDAASHCHGYAERTGMPAYTPNSLRTVEALLKDIVAIRERGYAFDQEEAELGMSCVAAPIMDGDGSIVAGLSISARTVPSGWGPRVREAAETVTHSLLRSVSVS